MNAPCPGRSLPCWEKNNYSADAVYDGQEALEYLEAGNYDALILDLMMPKIDGLQACMRIREFSNVPIIMLTARSEDTDKIIGFECGGGRLHHQAPSTFWS